MSQLPHQPLEFSAILSAAETGKTRLSVLRALKKARIAGKDKISPKLSIEFLGGRIRSLKRQKVV
jgi:hypothetical protein